MSSLSSQSSSLSSVSSQSSSSQSSSSLFVMDYPWGKVIMKVGPAGMSATFSGAAGCSMTKVGPVRKLLDVPT